MKEHFAYLKSDPTRAKKCKMQKCKKKQNKKLLTYFKVKTLHNVALKSLQPCSSAASSTSKLQVQLSAVRTKYNSRTDLQSKKKTVWSAIRLQPYLLPLLAKNEIIQPSFHFLFTSSHPNVIFRTLVLQVLYFAASSMQELASHFVRYTFKFEQNTCGNVTHTGGQVKKNTYIVYFSYSVILFLYFSRFYLGILYFPT